MVKVIGVKFRNSGRVYYFDPGDLDIQAGQGVVVETARGVEYADVTMGVTEVEDDKVVSPLKPVQRIATDEDLRMRQYYWDKEKEAFLICEQKIAEHGLDMKLVNVEYNLTGSKVVFYFTADDRVDFRELVKDLAYVFKTRIELRQIGVRDEAKMLGGLGPCGRPVCCKQFLDDFRPVTIKMAKEQNLALSPTKISGLCGRLMCCLQYEESCYEQMHKLMPRTGKEIETPDGVGIVDQYVFKLPAFRTVHLDDTQFKALAYDAVLLVGAKEHRLAVLEIESMALAALSCVDVTVGSIVESDTVLQHFDDGCALVVGCACQDVYRSRSVRRYATRKVGSLSPKSQCSGTEGVLDGTIRRALGDKASK